MKGAAAISPAMADMFPPVTARFFDADGNLVAEGTVSGDADDHIAMITSCDPEVFASLELLDSFGLVCERVPLGRAERIAEH